MMRQASVFHKDIFAGLLVENGGEYRFRYDADYLSRPDASAISLTFPLQSDDFVSPTLFPFFDGLIPEGWLLSVVTRNWKLDPEDRFGLLLVSCEDSIGDVSVKNADDADIIESSEDKEVHAI